MKKARRHFSTGSFLPVSLVSTGPEKGFPWRPSLNPLPNLDVETLKPLLETNRDGNGDTSSYQVLNIGAAATRAFVRRTSGLPATFVSIYLLNSRLCPGESLSFVLADQWREP
jgi:hypothetical protein